MSSAGPEKVKKDPIRSLNGIAKIIWIGIKKRNKITMKSITKSQSSLKLLEGLKTGIFFTYKLMFCQALELTIF